MSARERYELESQGESDPCGMKRVKIASTQTARTEKKVAAGRLTSSFVTPRSALHSVEPLKDQVLLLLRDTHSGVLNRESKTVRTVFGANGDGLEHKVEQVRFRSSEVKSKAERTPDSVY